MGLFHLVNPWRLEKVLYTEGLPGVGENRLHGWLLPSITRALFDLDSGVAYDGKLNDQDSGRVLVRLREKHMRNLQAKYVELLVWSYTKSEDAMVGSAVWLEIERIKHALIQAANSRNDIHKMDIAYIVTVLTPLHR